MLIFPEQFECFIDKKDDKSLLEDLFQLIFTK